MVLGGRRWRRRSKRQRVQGQRRVHRPPGCASGACETKATSVRMIPSRPQRPWRWWRGRCLCVSRLRYI
jgi:hypothetical protein